MQNKMQHGTDTLKSEAASVPKFLFVKSFKIVYAHFRAFKRRFSH